MRNQKRVLLGIISIEGFLTTYFYAKAPSEINSQFLLGYSLPKIILIIDTFFLTLYFAFLFLRTKKVTNIIEKRDAKYLNIKLVFSFFIIFFFGSIVFLVPQYRLGELNSYVVQLKPLFVWFFLIAVKIFYLSLKERKDLYVSVSSDKKVLFLTLLVFFCLLLVWAFISISQFGVKPDPWYWNVPGVPILNEQILFSALLSVVFLVFYSKFNRDRKFIDWASKKIDIIIFFILWGSAAIMWILEPLPKSFFAIGPYPPNHEFYPYGDPIFYDTSSQFALIGQGLFNGWFYDRALLPGFLSFAHLLFGQNYTRIANFQSLVFALLIPVMYLLGKKLYSRSAGIFLAVLSIYKVINSIASSTIIQSSHPKFLSTEFPTAFAVGLLALCLLNWHENFQKSIRYLGVIGGLLGLGIMLRTNVFLLFSIPFFLILINKEVKFGRKMGYSFILVLAFFVTISPWMWRNAKVANKPLFFIDRFNSVISERYSAEEIYPVKTRSLVRNSENENITNKVIGLSTYNELPFIPNHFFHNIVSSVLILPTSFEFHDLPHTLKDIFPYWGKFNTLDTPRNGSLTLGEVIVICFNLFLIALGLSISWRQKRSAGLIPLLIFLIYHLSNGLARTSGGRYLVPVDWVVLLYYAIGFIHLVRTGLHRFGVVNLNRIFDNNVVSSSRRGKVSAIFIVLPLIIVTSITLIDQVIPQKYSEKSTEELILEIEALSRTNDITFDSEQLLNFAKDPNARILFGRALYPRFYNAGKGEIWLEDGYEIKDFSRLSYTMIGTFGRTGVVLPLDKPPAYFPNAVDTIIVACQHPYYTPGFTYVDAKVVFVLEDDQSIVYKTEPQQTLQCEEALSN